MLLSFSVSNYLSIRDRQEISMVASSLSEDQPAFDVQLTADVSGVLPCALIYGANASGKSNFLNAIAFVRTALAASHSKWEPDNGIPLTAFLLDKNCNTKPTEFEISFVEAGVRYDYGFEATKKEFLREWLYAFPNNRRRKIFERDGDSVEFGASFKGQKNILVGLMRDNSLFASVVRQNKQEAVEPLFKFFRKMKFFSEIAVGGYSVSSQFKGGSLDQRSIDFLSGIGTGVFSHKEIEHERPQESAEFLKELNQVMSKHLGEIDLDVEETTVEIQLGHRGSGGEDIFLSLDSESAGTRRLLVVLNGVFEALSRGGVILLDELDASLHTYACEAIVEIFKNRELNPNNAQLIATTHDTNLLSSQHLRRDEIWFAEKDNLGASEYYSLADVRSRKSDDFEAGYLQGRYGAVPPMIFKKLMGARS